MDALDAIRQRVSVQRVGGKAPDRSQRDAIYAAALRVPDHAQLKPWRFLEVEGDGLDGLGELFVEALRANKTESGEEVTAREIVRTKAKPLRAPLVIVVIASPKVHPKVPEVEQLLSAGTAAQNILLASHALGVGAMWRTGGVAYDPIVKAGLGLKESEHIVGFIYLGEPEGELRQTPTVAIEEYFQSWPPQT